MATGWEGEFQAVITDQAVAAPGDIRWSPELSHGKGVRSVAISEELYWSSERARSIDNAASSTCI